MFVDAGNPPNDPIFTPGSWTYPDYGDPPATYEIILGPSENLTGINFGWDYQFLPAAEEDTSDDTSWKGKLSKNAFCRSGPGNYYDTDTAFPIGTEFEILGRSELDLPLWLFIEEWYLKFRCWIWHETAEYEVDPTLIPTVVSPPTPTPIVCRKDLNQEACEKSGGTWYPGPAAAPYCMCP